MNFQQVSAIKEQFAQAYMFSEPWSDYVNMVGISKVGLLDDTAEDEEKEDACIGVGLLKPLPPDLVLPTEYQGVKVYLMATGVIRPLQQTS